MRLPERCFLLQDAVYLHYRLPFEEGLQFRIKFHTYNKSSENNDENDC